MTAGAAGMRDELVPGTGAVRRAVEAAPDPRDLVDPGKVVDAP